jgi:hypothetical protein
MIRHLLQIFFTLGLTFITVSSGAGHRPARAWSWRRPQVAALLSCWSLWFVYL